MLECRIHQTAHHHTKLVEHSSWLTLAHVELQMPSLGQGGRGVFNNIKRNMTYHTTCFANPQPKLLAKGCILVPEDPPAHWTAVMLFPSCAILYSSTAASSDASFSTRQESSAMPLQTSSSLEGEHVTKTLAEAGEKSRSK